MSNACLHLSPVCCFFFFLFFFFFFNDPATTEIYTLSLHDALRDLRMSGLVGDDLGDGLHLLTRRSRSTDAPSSAIVADGRGWQGGREHRSEQPRMAASEARSGQRRQHRPSA